MSETFNEQYVIREKIGEGGMGTVYLAEDILLERPVAIKVLNKPVSAAPESLESRFQQEALALARLNHPNITHLYAFVPKQDTYWMVMEYVEGKTLEEWLQLHGSLNVRTACSILVQILDGLEHAHRKGIIHRDLKPANVMISADGEVKIMDFGIARIRNSQRLTQLGKSVGTLEYMAPEQIQGKEGDELTDIYAAGNILYELLSGQAPFKADTDYHLMKAKLEEKAPHHPALISKASASLQEVVFRALERNPQKRYSSVKFFKEALLKNTGNDLFASNDLVAALQSRQDQPLAPQEVKAALPGIRALLAGVALSSVKIPGIQVKSRSGGSKKLSIAGIAAYLKDWNTDKSVKLLIAVIILCAALITWNYISADDATTLSGKPGIPSADMQAAASPQVQPTQKQTGIIETQLIENHRPELPPETTAPNEKNERSGKKEPPPSREIRKKDNPPANKTEAGSPAQNEPASQEPVKEENRPAETKSQTPSGPVSIPEGRSVLVVLDENISSELKSKDGSIVALHCAEDITVNGTVIVKEGAMVTGKIVDVEPSGKRRKALVGFVVQKIKAADGKPIRVHSERFRLRSSNPGEPAVYKSGTSFTVTLGRGTVF
jgi:serine/threonine-protein kinase